MKINHKTLNKISFITFMLQQYTSKVKNQINLFIFNQVFLNGFVPLT